MNQNLVETLARVDKPAQTWISPDRSEVLILPYGGRIIGLFTPGSDRNFFWTHPALEKPDTAETLFRSAAWHNSGGDRTWLAPEVDFFFPQFPELEVFQEPRELDPGNFENDSNHGSVSLRNRCSLRLSRSKQTVDLVLQKRIEPALNPLREFDSSGDLAYAGYTLRTQLSFTRGKPKLAQVGIWNLLQLPHGGDLLMPTTSKAPIEMYMGKIEAQDLSVTDRLVRYRMRATGKHKFGIQAPVSTGRAGYLCTEGDDASLVIRNFFVNPSGEYIDVPWADTTRAGSVVQACLINCELGKYSELEYHAPAIGGAEGPSSCEDVSQVWAFRGKKESVIAAARILLSGEI